MNDINTTDAADEQRSADAEAGQSALSASSRMREDAIQHVIGQNLKSIYGAILQEPIPDDILRRLDELERKEQQR